MNWFVNISVCLFVCISCYILELNGVLIFNSCIQSIFKNLVQTYIFLRIPYLPK